MSVLDRMCVQGRDDIAGGLVAENGETTVRTRVRGGPGRTRTSNQAVMRAATAGKVSVIFATPAHVLPTVVLVWLRLLAHRHVPAMIVESICRLRSSLPLCSVDGVMPTA